MVHARDGRRKLLIALGASTVLPRVALAQQGKVWVVGFLTARSRDAAVEMPPFIEGMRELGYVEGRNVRYEWRFADGNYKRLRPLADELVRLGVDVLVASTSPAALAARDATRTIPIVMQSAADPVGLGLVASLARPGGNITGVSNIIEGIPPKQLDMLVEAIPKLSRVAVLINVNDPSIRTSYKGIDESAKRHGVSLVRMQGETLEAIEQSFARMKHERCQAFIVVGSAFFTQHRARMVDLAAKARLPGIYYRREFVEAGGLMSYGRNSLAIYKRSTFYVDKILKGTKPADLPVEQPQVIELVLNRGTAKALGVTFPGNLLVRADKIIE